MQRRSPPCAEILEARLLLARLAVIGDYSSIDDPGPTGDVAALVASWNPDGVLTVGDNNYPDGEAATIDSNIGQWYHSFIHPYTGSYGAGSVDGQNHFWPALGNHDWNTGTVAPYTNYFTLPNNERYYTVQIGDVAVFVVDSDPQEPDGNSANSVQANWLHSQMQASTAKWKLVTFHHPPYSSGADHGNSPWMQWPFKAWGATAVLGGHDHDYERLNVGGLTYFVNGLGGKSLYGFSTPVAGSQVRYNGDYGAMLIDSTADDITFKFITRTGLLIDTYTFTPSNQGIPQTLIPTGSTWKYRDNGSDQGTAWRALGFNDNGWASGAAELGYGDGDETTVVSYGPQVNSKHITTYFRKTITVSNPTAISALSLDILRDDGAVVYLNGSEIYRTNMPAGAINSSTPAVTGVEDNGFYTTDVNPSLLVAGSNVIAVEIHQSAGTSSDISFDFQLTAFLTPPPVIPSAPSPNGTIDNAAPVTLDWADVPSATSFDVLVGASGTLLANVTASQLVGWIPPADGVQLWRIVARNSSGNTPGPQWSFTLDRTAPTAAYGGQSPAAGNATFDFTVTYADATTAVDPTTFDGNDITVTGPAGFSANAAFISAAANVATYRIAAPGGTWNLVDSGVYTISQNAAQVKDTANNARAAGAIGTFTAAIPFAWKSGSTLNVEFNGSAQPITLSAIGSNFTAAAAYGSFTCSGVTNIAVFGTASNDALQIIAPLPPTLTFANGGGDDSVRILAGSYTFAAPLAPSLGNIAVGIDSGAVGVFACDQHLSNLTVAGRLDLRDSEIIIDHAALGSWDGTRYTGISGLIQSGRNEGTWNGNGIFTSLSDVGDGVMRTVGVGEASRLLFLNGAETALWNGVTVSATSVIVKYTYAGDVDLNGEINGDDYFDLDSNILLNGVVFDYLNGDINLDGELNGDDYFWLDSNILAQGPPL